MQESPSITIESNYLSQTTHLAGVDEVGRGPLAGPVAACAVLASGELGQKPFNNFLSRLHELGVTDSKKLSAKRRQKILAEFGMAPETLQLDQKVTLVSEKNYQLHYAIAEISPVAIDQMNILNAALTAMGDAYRQCLPPTVEKERSAHLLVDGQYQPIGIPKGITVTPLIKGDSKSKLIALASIIAKEYRDHLMEKMDQLYPGYGFAKHAGYPTKAHKEALARLGVLPIHRKSFKGVAQFVAKQ